jgi:hypothetical protein
VGALDGRSFSPQEQCSKNRVMVMGTGENCYPMEDFLFDYAHEIFIIAARRLFWYIYSAALAINLLEFV